jgi:SOS-response transcriptional repressor LexA
MNEAETRPSKRQRELLSFIDSFIKGNGYGPSYREIMRALDYKSVSTVAVHVDGLITRGLLRKKDNSARSLELVSVVTSRSPQDVHIEWLARELEKRKDGSETDKKEATIIEEVINIFQKKRLS